MEKELIAMMVDTLPVSATKEEDRGPDGDADCAITRTRMPDALLIEIITLEIKGPPTERKRVIQDFNLALGKPIEWDTRFSDSSNTDIVEWHVPAFKGQ